MAVGELPPSLEWCLWRSGVGVLWPLWVSLFQQALLAIAWYHLQRFPDYGGVGFSAKGQQMRISSQLQIFKFTRIFIARDVEMHSMQHLRIQSLPWCSRQERSTCKKQRTLAREKWATLIRIDESRKVRAWGSLATFWGIGNSVGRTQFKRDWMKAGRSSTYKNALFLFSQAYCEQTGNSES